MFPSIKINLERAQRVQTSAKLGYAGIWIIFRYIIDTIVAVSYFPPSQGI